MRLERRFSGILMIYYRPSGVVPYEEYEDATLVCPLKDLDIWALSCHFTFSGLRRQLKRKLFNFFVCLRYMVQVSLAYNRVVRTWLWLCRPSVWLVGSPPWVPTPTNALGQRQILALISSLMCTQREKVLPRSTAASFPSICCHCRLLVGFRWSWLIHHWSSIEYCMSSALSALTTQSSANRESRIEACQ